jgi:hypothetical protein
VERFVGRPPESLSSSSPAPHGLRFLYWPMHVIIQPSASTAAAAAAAAAASSQTLPQEICACGQGVLGLEQMLLLGFERFRQRVR